MKTSLKVLISSYLFTSFFMTTAYAISYSDACEGGDPAAKQLGSGSISNNYTKPVKVTFIPGDNYSGCSSSGGQTVTVNPGDKYQYWVMGEVAHVPRTKEATVEFSFADSNKKMCNYVLGIYSGDGQYYFSAANVHSTAPGAELNNVLCSQGGRDILINCRAPKRGCGSAN